MLWLVQLKRTLFYTYKNHIKFVSSLKLYFHAVYETSGIHSFGIYPGRTFFLSGFHIKQGIDLKTYLKISFPWENWKRIRKVFRKLIRKLLTTVTRELSTTDTDRVTDKSNGWKSLQSNKHAENCHRRCTLQQFSIFDNRIADVYTDKLFQKRLPFVRSP